MFSVLFLVSSLLTYAQKDTIYADENDKYISKKDFYNKMNSSIYYGHRFENDSLVLQKIRFNYFFRKLSPTIKNQLFKLLNKRQNIDTTKTFIIQYIDTLKAIKEFPKRNSVIYKDSLNYVVKINNTGNFIDLNKIRKIIKHNHFFNHKTFIKQHEKWLKEQKKFNKSAEVFHFYSFNNGHPEKFKNVYWYKDYGLVIKKIFSDGYENFSNIIIHPDGTFYLQRNKINKIPYEIAMI